MFKHLWLFFGSVLVVVPSNLDQLRVNYYVNLYTEETAKAHTYEKEPESWDYWTLNKQSKEYGTYDYIIIGAGSAGSVIANRLTEIPENQVLVLEAGGFETHYTDIPSAFMYLQGSEFNWNYTSVPQSSSCLGMIDRGCPYPRGKGLGGSSIINAGMYARGNKLDYDEWANDGNAGWSYEDVLPYFIKSENSNINGDAGYHGKNGCLNVEYLKSNNIQYEAFVEANLELNRKMVDYNGKEQLGVAQAQMTTINGQRCSAGRAFLGPIMNRENLAILTNSFVTKILIDRQTRTAYGVLFTKGHRLYVAYARKEVVLSAGTINSPQLLMLSGIGPSDHLTDLDIETIQDLQVGENLHDHPTYFTLMFTTNYTEPMRDLKQSVEEYLKGYGDLTKGGNSQGVAFLQTGKEGKPDIQQIMIPSFNTNEYFKRILHLTDDTYVDTFDAVDPSNSFSIYVMLLHPKSRGTLKLKSKSPYEYPLIDPRFLSDSDSEDIETMYRGIELAIELMDTNAFRRLNASLIYNPLRVCRHHKYLSREFWYCQSRQLSFHLFHPVGTCKMGPDPLQGDVVDSELRVHGISRLRVADASVIPKIVSGNTNAPTIMIGEKASDLIKLTKY